MPTYLIHGFRWPRPLIRIHIVLQNLDDAAAEWLMQTRTTEAMLSNFRALYPDAMAELPNLRFLEQYDPSDEKTKSQPFAYVADIVHEVTLGIDIDEVRGRGVTNEAWSAMVDLRDRIAPGEKFAWFVVVCGDVDRYVPTASDLMNAGGAAKGGSAFDLNDNHATPTRRASDKIKGLLSGMARKKPKKHSSTSSLGASRTMTPLPRIQSSSPFNFPATTGAAQVRHQLKVPEQYHPHYQSQPPNAQAQPHTPTPRQRPSSTGPETLLSVPPRKSGASTSSTTTSGNTRTGKGKPKPRAVYVPIQIPASNRPPRQTPAHIPIQIPASAMPSGHPSLMRGESGVEGKNKEGGKKAKVEEGEGKREVGDEKEKAAPGNGSENETTKEKGKSKPNTALEKPSENPQPQPSTVTANAGVATTTAQSNSTSGPLPNGSATTSTVLPSKKKSKSTTASPTGTLTRHPSQQSPGAAPAAPLPPPPPRSSSRHPPLKQINSALANAGGRGSAGSHGGTAVVGWEKRGSKGASERSASKSDSPIEGQHQVKGVVGEKERKERRDPRLSLSPTPAVVSPPQSGTSSPPPSSQQHGAGMVAVA